MKDVNTFSSDGHENRSGPERIEDKLKTLRAGHHFYNPDAEGLPTGLQKVRRDLTPGLDSAPRRIRVGRETEDIIQAADTLFKRAQGENENYTMKLDEIETIEHLLKDANRVRSLALRNDDRGTGGGTTSAEKAERERALAELKEIAAELEKWERYTWKGEGKRPITRRGIEINRLLKELPEKSPNAPYTIHDLDDEDKWILYIDDVDRENAEKESEESGNDPGTFYDRDEAPGYKKSMDELFRYLFATEQTGKQKNMDYEEYTKCHRLATEHLPEDKRQHMCQENSLVRLPTNDMPTYHVLLPPKNVREREERDAALEEMRKERINGLPLLQDWPPNVEPLQASDGFYPEILSQLPRGIVIGQKIADLFVIDKERGITLGKDSTLMLPLYSRDEGRGLVDAILASYYDGRKIPGQTKYQRLIEISKTIRQLNMVHQKRDGMGRLHYFGILNKFLQEEGFPPTILPNRPTGWGGEKTLDETAKGILDGMYTFIREANRRKKR